MGKCKKKEIIEYAVHLNDSLYHRIKEYGINYEKNMNYGSGLFHQIIRRFIEHATFHTEQVGGFFEASNGAKLPFYVGDIIVYQGDRLYILDILVMLECTNIVALFNGGFKIRSKQIVRDYIVYDGSNTQVLGFDGDGCYLVSNKEYLYSGDSNKNISLGNTPRNIGDYVIYCPVIKDIWSIPKDMFHERYETVEQ